MRNELHIDSLELHLPAGFERRGPSIARHAIRHLGGLLGAEGSGAAGARVAQLSALNIGAVVVHPAEANAVIGRRIAHQIHHELRRGGSLA